MEVGCVFSLLAAKIDTGMHVLPALSDVVYHWPPSGGEELARSEMAWFYPRLVLFVLFFCSFFFFAAGDEDTLPSWECIKVIDTMKSAITRVRISWLRRQRCYRGCVCAVCRCQKGSMIAPTPTTLSPGIGVTEKFAPIVL